MNRTDIILIILANKENRIVGTTRLQKLVFLAENEKKIKEDDGPFDFEAYRFGPFSKKLCDDIEFLLNLGYLEKSGEGTIIESSISLDDIETLQASHFLSNKSNNDFVEDEEGIENQSEVNTATDDSVVYRITVKGIQYLEDNKILGSNFADQVIQIREKYGKRSLIELLQYIYLKYPNYTTESEIKGKIL